MLLNGNNFNNNQNNFGNNNLNHNNGFIKTNFKRNDPYENINNNNKSNNRLGFNEELSTYKHTNPTNDIDMYDKSIAMLHERYENNLISLDEFQKKCAQIGKKKRAALENRNKY